jgi:hypothetical protein
MRELVTDSWRRIASKRALASLAATGSSTPKKTSFDWHRAALSLGTQITRDYRSTQNVRRFFKAQIGNDFRFTAEFMKWMRASPGKTLEAAVLEWKRRYRTP